VPKKTSGTASRRKATPRKKTTAVTKKTTATKKATATKRTTPRKPASKPKATVGKLRVKQVRSGIGHAATYRRTLRALGLKHHQAEVMVDDNPSIKGMLHKVRHLVRVTEE
jgi:large subunit ribosomal protein L30